MSGSQILQGKHAIVFGAAGTIGTAVVKEFAAEGAEVFLSWRTKSQISESLTANTASLPRYSSVRSKMCVVTGS